MSIEKTVHAINTARNFAPSYQKHIFLDYLKAENCHWHVEFPTSVYTLPTGTVGNLKRLEPKKKKKKSCPFAVYLISTTEQGWWQPGNMLADWLFWVNITFLAQSSSLQVCCQEALRDGIFTGQESSWRSGYGSASPKTVQLRNHPVGRDYGAQSTSGKFRRDLTHTSHPFT